MCHLVVVGAHCSCSWINDFNPFTVITSIEMSDIESTYECNMLVVDKSEPSRVYFSDIGSFIVYKVAEKQEVVDTFDFNYYCMI